MGDHFLTRQINFTPAVPIDSLAGAFFHPSTALEEGHELSLVANTEGTHFRAIARVNDYDSEVDWDQAREDLNSLITFLKQYNVTYDGWFYLRSTHNDDVARVRIINDQVVVEDGEVQFPSEGVLVSTERIDAILAELRAHLIKAVHVATSDPMEGYGEGDGVPKTAEQMREMVERASELILAGNDSVLMDLGTDLVTETINYLEGVRDGLRWALGDFSEAIPDCMLAVIQRAKDDVTNEIRNRLS